MAVPAAPISIVPDAEERAFCKTFVSSLSEICSIGQAFFTNALSISARLLMLFDAGRLMVTFIRAGGSNRYFIHTSRCGRKGTKITSFFTVWFMDRGKIYYQFLTFVRNDKCSSLIKAKKIFTKNLVSLQNSLYICTENIFIMLNRKFRFLP